MLRYKLAKPARALVVSLALTCGVAQRAEAQTTYSVEEYLEMQSGADALYEQLLATPLATPEREAVAQSALDARLGLLGYLSDWVFSGQMPDEMTSSAYETRVVLYQNIIAIQEELGRCGDAEEAAEELERMAERHPMTETISDAIAYGWASVARCHRSAETASGAESDATPDTTGDATGDATPDAVSEPPDDEVAPVDADPALATAPVAPDAGLHPGWIVTAVGAGLVGAGAYVALGPLQRTNSRLDDWSADPSAMPSDADILGTEQQAERYDYLASGLVISGALAMAGGLAWRYLERPPAAVAVGWSGRAPVLVIGGVLP